MRASSSAILAIAFVSTAAALSSHEAIALSRRQEPGTPEYDCHADCGGVIVDSRTEGYCDTANFTTQLSACLDCALEYEIWQYYGNSVTTAAQGCGLDATPVPASSANGSSTADSSSSSAPATATESATSSATSTPAPTSSGADTAPGSTTSEAASAETFTGAGSKNMLASGLAMVPLGALVAGVF